MDAGGIGVAGHGLAGGDTGGEVEGDEGFAEAGVAVEDGKFATRDAVGPEPVKLLRFDVGEGCALFGGDTGGGVVGGVDVIHDGCRCFLCASGVDVRVLKVGGNGYGR